MNILYINYSYSLGGVNGLRVYELLNQFSKKKISITHLTPKKSFSISGIKNLVITPSYKKNSKLKDYFYNFIYPLYSPADKPIHRTWNMDVKKYLLKHKKNIGHFDYIYVNTQPRCLSLVGAFAKKLFNAKLVIDFQDPFYFDPYQPNLSIFSFFRKKTEEKYLKSCDLLITNTPSAEKIYRKNYPGKKIHTVANMIPHYIANLKKGKNIDKNKKINILYGGSIYVGRDIFMLAKILKILNKKRLKLEIMGSFSFYNKFRYRKYKNINWKQKLSFKKYLKYLDGNAHIGVVLQNFKQKKTGVSCIAAKTYEYLGLNKSIIYIGPDGDNAKIIKKYSTNSCVITDPKKQEEKLLSFLKNFKAIGNPTRESFFKKYSSDFLSKILIKHLKEIK